jgi:glycerate kinase
MRIVVAPDSFKGTLTAEEAGEAIRLGLLDARPDIVVDVIPLADGGEGTATVVGLARGGRWNPVRCTGPLPGQTVDAGWLSLEGQGGAVEALVEMASASGLNLAPAPRRDPLKTTTRGTGELLRAAAEAGSRVIRLAVGGSATVDGGVGAASALGWRFLDQNGRDVPHGGEGLLGIRSLVPPDPNRWSPGRPLFRSGSGEVAAFPSLEVLSDVNNPLLGPRGAATVFAPQKGAGPSAVVTLEAGLAHLAERIREELGIEVAGVAGAGAAGGLAAGACAFLGGRLRSGIDWVLDAVGFVDAIRGADLVVTGEGRFDAQSLAGKVVAGVTERARGLGVPTAVLAGRIALGEPEWTEAGIHAALAVLSGRGGDSSLPEPAEASAALRARARDLFSAASP